MRKLSRPLAIVLMAAALPAAVAFAEDTPAPDKPAIEKHRPSPDTLARIEEGRIAFAKAALKLSPEQEKLWAPVEEKIRANFADRQKMFADWEAKSAEFKTKDDKTKPENLPLPERLEKRSEHMAKMSEQMAKRAASSKELAAALKPLYASFSAEQNAVASKALDPFVGKDPRRHGPRWAMHRRGFGHGHGPDAGGPKMGPKAD